MWSAETIDLEHSKCTTYDPESTARALQSTILEKLSKSVMYEMLGTDLTIEITIEISGTDHSIVISFKIDLIL